MGSLLAQRRWDLVYVEGTAVSAGVQLLTDRRRHRYVISAGDPVAGFFYATHGPVLGRLMSIYERLLLRQAAGFVGWTPYLTGRAVEIGVPRAITVEGGVDLEVFRPPSRSQKIASRRRFNLPESHLVCGVVGSLRWVPRQRYCYGLELADILTKVRRNDVTMFIVGDGDGRAEIERRVPTALKHRLVFSGRLSESDVVEAIGAMDLGFVTQTQDRLGSFRLTTKLPEYLACGIPVAMSPVPGFYDYVRGAGWSLVADHPASPSFSQKCAQWLDTLTLEAVAAAGQHARLLAEQRFDYSQLRERFQAFLVDLMG